MAYMVPERISPRATAGERRLFHVLKEHLPDDYVVYYEPEIHGKRPDFVIIGPDLGLVVLEVKDYVKSTLYALNKDEWQLRTSSGELTTVKSPMKQAREYVFHIANFLKRDKSLVHLDGKYIGNLKFPYGFGVVLTRLSQKDLVTENLYQVLEPHQTLASDEIDEDAESFSVENLIEKITNMFVFRTNRSVKLSDEDIRAIRYHLFPEVRISAENREPVPYQDQLLLSLHDIKVMDLHQENLAKQLGDKHRLIRGVAGSGKTLILASRAKMLAKQHPDWKILILCYNITLSSFIRQMVERMMSEPDDLFDLVPENQPDNIEVRNFHEWLKFDLKIKTGDEGIATMINKLEKGEAILPTYDAILIDEGQDFQSEWLRLVSLLLNEDTQSLLLVEDRAQSIYGRKRSYVQDTGLDFRGRSRILTINYRNTAQIVEFAWDFYQRFSLLQNKIREGQTDGVEILPPQSSKRKGPPPAVVRATSFREEMRMVARQIKRFVEAHKLTLSDMLILYRVKNTHRTRYIDIIRSVLTEAQIPFHWVSENETSKRNFAKEDDTVKICTIDSSKGLDFRAVFIVNADNMPFELEEDKEREVNLLYIAMTRAIEYLCVSYSGNSAFTEYFEEIREKRDGAREEDAAKGKVVHL